jgi:transcriptional regulator with XRE-family HTH domain
MDIGTRLRVIRQMAGLKQEEIAERIGRTQGHVARIEKGERQPTYRDMELWIAAAGADPLKFHDGRRWSEAERIWLRYESEMASFYARMLSDVARPQKSGAAVAQKTANRDRDVTPAAGPEPQTTVFRRAQVAVLI